MQEAAVVTEQRWRPGRRAKRAEAEGVAAAAVIQSQRRVHQADARFPPVEGCGLVSSASDGLSDDAVPSG